MSWHSLSFLGILLCKETWLVKTCQIRMQKYLQARKRKKNKGLGWALYSLCQSYNNKSENPIKTYIKVCLGTPGTILFSNYFISFCSFTFRNKTSVKFCLHCTELHKPRPIWTLTFYELVKTKNTEIFLRSDSVLFNSVIMNFTNKYLRDLNFYWI